MSWKATIRAAEAAERRREREAQKQRRELERRAKEQAKLSALEQALLEVATYENQLDVLLSVHKEQSEAWDWIGLATHLTPHCPHKFSRNEFKARQAECIARAGFVSHLHQDVDQAKLQDEHEYKQALEAYSNNKAESEKMAKLARRVLAGEHKSYTEVLSEFSPWSEISDLGSTLHFTVHSSKLLECVLKVNGSSAIPTEVKSLTASGKLSVKPMPKARFHEIYQDYVCGCILRIAREVFAMLPVDTILVTASADIFSTSTGKSADQPVLSVAIPRTTLQQLEFDRLDPSDAMENFMHRGDFKASRKSGAFQPIIPLTASDLLQEPLDNIGFSDLVRKVQRLRDELQQEIQKFTLRTSVSSFEDQPAA